MDIQISKRGSKKSYRTASSILLGECFTLVHAGEYHIRTFMRDNDSMLRIPRTPRVTATNLKTGENIFLGPDVVVQPVKGTFNLEFE